MSLIQQLTIMKYWQNFLAIIFIIIYCFCIGCNSESKRETDEPHLPDIPAQEPNTSIVKVIAQTIAQNSVVKAQNTPSLTLSYSASINISNINLITLNDRVVTNAETCDSLLIIPLSLEPNTKYVLKVQSGAIFAGGNNTVNPFTLTFRTQAVANINQTDKEPCNVYASIKAKALYDYFRSIYGKSTVFGATEHQFNSYDYSELLYTESQHYPAILEYELNNIHALNYENISNILKHNNAGGVVSICWKWVTPSQKDDLNSSYSLDSNFDIKHAINAGNWEFLFVENELQHIAEIMQKFKDENITILFNPMRIAQNHWWSKRGGAYFKELWWLIYDRLAIKYRLDNLIWVWSTETTDMTCEELKQWYPGNEYVDIIGTNIYSENVNSQIDRFILLNETFEGKKMLAITECGNILDISKCYDSGDTWLYLCSKCSINNDSNPYLDCIYKLNTPNRIKALLNHENVLTLDDFFNLN